MHAKLYVEKSGTKIEIDRRVIDRIASENQQNIDLPGLHIVHKIAKRLDSIDGIRFEWVGVIDSLAHIPQRGIHCVRQCVHVSGLLVSSNYQGRAAMLLQ